MDEEIEINKCYYNPEDKHFYRVVKVQDEIAWITPWLVVGYHTLSKIKIKEIKQWKKKE